LEVTDDAVLLRAERFNCFLRFFIEVVDAEADNLASESVEGMFQ